MNFDVSTTSVNPGELLDALDNSWGLPARFYVDPDIFQLDLNAIFRREWQYIAPAAKLQNIGDVVVGHAGDIPVVVARARDGHLHGFVNVCRHRGYRVCESDSKDSKHLVCKYHAWAYALDGSLIGAPGGAEDASFCKSELSLLPVSVEEWGPAVFVNADPQASGRLNYYPGMADAVDIMKIDLDPNRYTLHRETRHEVNSNWKMWFDNFVECYHCENIHSGSFSEAYDANIKTVENYFHSRFMTNRFAPKSATSNTELRARDYRSSVAFPGFLILQQEHLMILSQMRPLGPERTEQIVHYFSDAGSDPALVDRWVDLWEQTFTEDGEATAIQQTGFRTGIVKRNRLMMQREEAVFFFNRQTCSAYQNYLDSKNDALTEH